jgi:anaerobic ribonucleoside-triphosphate reductase
LKIPTEIYSRVSGYFRPVSQWNKGKQEEFCERTMASLREDHDK